MAETEDLRSQLEALRKILEEERRKTEEERRRIEEERREERRKMEEERRKIEEERRKMKEERRKKEAKHISKGIPSVPLFLSSTSKPSPKCSLNIMEMNIFHIFESIRWDMTVGTTTRDFIDLSGDTVSLRSERDVDVLVEHVIKDIIAACGLKCALRTQYSLAPTRGRPLQGDIVVLTCVAQIPFAVVGLKRDAFCKADHFQLKRYMDLVTAETGAPVLGVLSNYFEWRVAWHSVIPSDVLTATTLEETMNALSQIKGSLEPPSADSLSVSTWYDIRKEKPETVPKLIATFLHKALMLSKLVPVASRVFPNGKTCWTIANASTTLRIFPQPDVMPVTPSAGCALLAAEYVLWRLLGSGLHGVVWLAYTMGTYVECAIKLGRSDEESLQNEVHAWHAQGEDGDDVLRQVGTTKLLTAPALVMPYVSPLGEEGLTQDALDKNLKQRVVLLARSGFCHDDLKLHHIGKLPDGRLVLLDFGSLSTNVDEQEAFGKMMSKLQDLVSSARGITQ
eukprot:Rmarinus@m.29923